MKILFCGDIVGASGRQIVLSKLPFLKTQLNLDVIIVNAENAAHGFGLTQGICHDLFKAGVDVITTGNHAFDHREIMPYMDHEKRLIRPLNYPKQTPGRGFTIISTLKGQKVLVVNLMGRVFMDPLDDPFALVDDLLKTYPLKTSVHAIVVDMHAEASSEKMAMGHFLDGRVSFVVGTHTHVPTADYQIFPHGSGYITDVGMCGDYDSVVGMDKTVPLYKFTRKLPPQKRMEPANGPGTLCGVYVETCDTTGLTLSIKPIRIGPRLDPYLPS